jgi:hypothetical protein
VKDISSSPLLSKIDKALAELGEESNGIRISISKDTTEVKRSQGGTATVRYLCWNIIDQNGNDITDPVLAIVHAELEEQTIIKDLNNLFPDRKYIVDNEIYLEDK